MLSATPINTTVEDLYTPSYILNPDLLDSSIYYFRYKYRDRHEFLVNNKTCIRWIDKPEAREMVVKALESITIKFKLDDCVEIPEQQTINHYVYIDPQTKAIKELVKQANIGDVVNGVININAPTTKSLKALQILSGSCYTIDKQILPVSDQRSILVKDLVLNYNHSIIAYQFTCVAKSIANQLIKHKISYGVINGNATAHERAKIVKDFQNGMYKTLLLQMDCAKHGITLTRANAVIWSTPTYNYETYIQINARIKRIGQNKKTCVVRITARATEEERVYKILDERLRNNNKMLEQFI
jgi:SNF2 family DNA or RNA helicase